MKKEEKKKQTSKNTTIYQKNENCQVFSGPISGCVFAMPGAIVHQSPVQQVKGAPDIQKESEDEMHDFADFEEMVDEKSKDNKPKVKVKPDLPPADVFVNRVKDIVMEMAKKNGEKIPAKPRGQAAEYEFFVDGQRISKMMDELRKNYESKINDFLSFHVKSKKYDGVMIVAPFIGGLLEMEDLRARELQYTDLEFAFVPYYRSAASAVRRLSEKMESAEAKMLYSLLISIKKKCPKS